MRSSLLPAACRPLEWQICRLSCACSARWVYTAKSARLEADMFPCYLGSLRSDGIRRCNGDLGEFACSRSSQSYSGGLLEALVEGSRFLPEKLESQNENFCIQLKVAFATAGGTQATRLGSILLLSLRRSVWRVPPAFWHRP